MLFTLQMNTTGKFFTVLGSYKYNFTLQNERRRRNFSSFKGLQRGFYLQNERRRRKFTSFKELKRGFCLQNERRRRKFSSFRGLQRAFPSKICCFETLPNFDLAAWEKIPPLVSDRNITRGRIFSKGGNFLPEIS